MDTSNNLILLQNMIAFPYQDRRGNFTRLFSGYYVTSVRLAPLGARKKLPAMRVRVKGYTQKIPNAKQ